MKVDEITLNNAMSVKAGTEFSLAFITCEEFPRELRNPRTGAFFPSLAGGVPVLNGLGVFGTFLSLHIYPKKREAMHFINSLSEVP